MLTRLYRHLSLSLAFTLVIALFLAVQVRPSWAQGLTDYRLVPGDILEFDLLADIDPSRQLTVGSDGSIQIPLLGAIRVGGLTIEEARRTVGNEFVNRKLLVEPNISLAVFSYRPIFVLGDVKTPGSFPIQYQLTVEQAVGLAGGPLTLQATTDDKIILRTRLEGEIAGAFSEISRDAAWVARLEAQLKGKDKVDPEDLPPEVRSMLLKSNAADSLLLLANQILTADRTAYESQRSILQSNLSEAEKQLSLFERLKENQQEAINFTKDELKRASKLLKSGLKTASDVSDIQRQVTNDEGRLLQILADTAGTQQQMAALKQQLAALEDGRKKDALLELQERKAVLGLSMAKLRAIENQLALLTNWNSPSADSLRQSILTYRVRAKAGESTGDKIVTPDTLLMPGDVLVVSIESTGPAAANLDTN